MPSQVQPDHPVNSLFFLLEGKPTSEFGRSFERMLDYLRDARSWVIAPPSLVDFFEEVDEPPGQTFESHTFGALLSIYSAFPPWGAKLPKDIDQLHYEEVTLLLNEVSRMSREAGVEFHLQLDDTFIGYIRTGVPDQSIRIALLEEWKRSLEASP